MPELKKIIFGVVFGYGIISLGFYLFQERIIFQPETLPNDHIFTFEHTFEEVFLETDDQATLNAVHFKNPNPKGVILYFHGNKGNLNRWGEIATFFAKKEYDVVIMDYRGYGKSTGKITEKNLYSDAQLFYDYVVKEYPENQITLYGRSLGTGIAVKLASENQPYHLILETPYYNINDIVTYWLPYFPTTVLLRYKIPSNRFINDANCNITIYHGTDDRVVSYKSGERLFKSILTPNKKMITIENGSHNDLITFDLYLNSIDSVLTNE